MLRAVQIGYVALGLAVCAHVVARNRGDLRVGRGPLGGALFTVQLRQAEAQP